MYLVQMIRHNRATYIKAFETFDAAADHADELVMNLRGVTNEMPDWQGGEVYEHEGDTVMVSGCDAPQDKNENIVNDWKINKSDYNNKYGKWNKN
jgi:hypothetical protein